MALSLVDELATRYDYSLQSFSPEIIEEYLIFHGARKNELDIPYLCRRERVSHNSVRKHIQTVFGTQKFKDEHPTPIEVSKEEFMQHYEFGLYPNVREWIGHIYRATGKVLPRNTLFQYLTEDNIDQRWEVTPNDYFV